MLILSLGSPGCVSGMNSASPEGEGPHLYLFFMHIKQQPYLLKKRTGHCMFVVFFIPKEAPMNALKLKPWFAILALLLISGVAPGVPAEGTFTLEQVLSRPYPSDLVSAKSADCIAWVFNSEGARNIWTAAGPDFAPVNLTRYIKDEVFEIPDVGVTGDGSIVVWVRGGNPSRRSWGTNPKSDPAGVR